MSLLNVWVEPRHALVAVDTLADHSQSNDGFIHCSKMLALPHAMTVLACRGDAFILSAAFSSIYLWPMSVGIHSILANLRSLLDEIVSHRPTCIPTEIVAVGWSRELDRTMALGFTMHAGKRRFTEQPVPSSWIGPNAGWPHAPAINSEQAMETVARQQVEFHRMKFPTAAIGGDLLLAEILSSEVSIRRIATLTEELPFHLSDDLERTELRA